MENQCTFKSVLLKSIFVVFALAICVGLCVFLIPDVHNEDIITLSALPGKPVQNNQNAAVLKNQPVAVEQTPAVNVVNNNSSVNVLTQAAVNLGVLSCVSRINQIATFLSANNQTGVFIFKPQKQPDQHIFSTSFELVRNDNSTVYASASFFPNQDAVYDTIEYVEKNCEELEKTVFSNLKRISVVKKNVVVLDGGAVKVFLMPAGSGTVVIKKEVVQ